MAPEALTGRRQMTSRAHLTFVTLPREGARARVPPLLLETDEEKQQQVQAGVRRAERLARRQKI